MEKEQCLQQISSIIDTYIYFKHNYAITVADLAEYNINCDATLFKHLMIFYEISIPELSNFISNKINLSDPQMDLYKIYSKGKNHREPSRNQVDGLTGFILEKRYDKYIKQIGLDNTFISTMDYFNLMQKVYQLKNRQDQRKYFEKRGISSNDATLDDITELNIDNPFLYSKKEIEAIINNCTSDEYKDFTTQKISDLRILPKDFLNNLQNINFLCHNFDTLFKFSNELIIIFDVLLRYNIHSLRKLKESKQSSKGFQYSPISNFKKIHVEAIMYSSLLGIEFIYDEIDEFGKNIWFNQMLSLKISDYSVNFIFYINLLHDIHWDITKLFLQEKANEFFNVNNAIKRKIIEKFVSCNE